MVWTRPTYEGRVAPLIVAVLVVLCLGIGAWLQPEQPHAEKLPKLQTEAEKVLRRLQSRRQRTTSHFLDPITAALEGRLPINQPFDEMDVHNGKLADNQECAPTGGITALMWACQWKLIEENLGGAPVLGADVVRVLLDAGADADVRCLDNGCSALSCESAPPLPPVTRALNSQMHAAGSCCQVWRPRGSQHAHRCWGRSSGPRLLRQKPSLERC